MSADDAELQRLIHKANQVAGFFGAQPHIDAAEAVTDHILKFWSPRLRAQAIAYLDEGGEGLAPLAKEALERIRPVS
jgi:formate dehydrogenase subunit delta